MEREIAVLLDKNDDIASGTEAEKIVKYVKNKEVWHIGQDIKIEVQNIEKTDLRESRNYYFDLIGKLGECRILVGKNIRGILFSVFSSADYLIMESDSFDTGMLDEIYHNAVNADKTVSKTDFPVQPQPTETQGEYYFDFLSLKREIKNITSRQTIKPFLEKKEFKKLTVLCDHKMPWLDSELERLDLSCEQEDTGSGVILLIQNRG